MTSPTSSPRSERRHTKPLSLLRSLFSSGPHPERVYQPRSQPGTAANTLRHPALSPIHLPVEIWEEIMKYLERPELHAISEISTIIRSISLPYLFNTVHLYAMDSPGLWHLVDGYDRKLPLCKNITELRLDYRQFLPNSDRHRLSTVGVISQTDANYFKRIHRDPMCCITTLVLHQVTLVGVWVQSIFSSQTLRRLHLDRCWFDKVTTPFPPTKISELVLDHIYDTKELGALVGPLAPQLAALEVHGVLPSAVLGTCPQLRRCVVQIAKGLNERLTGALRDFLIRTRTIEHLALGCDFPPGTPPLPARALPNLRVLDAALGDGVPGSKALAGPRGALRTLRITDDRVRSHDLGAVQHFLDVPYAVAELRLVLRKHNVAELLAAQLDRGLPGVERLALDIRANHVCLVARGDPGLCRDCTVLDAVLIGGSEFADRVHAARPIQADADADTGTGAGGGAGRTCSDKLKKIDVDIDVDSIGTTGADKLDAWFRNTLVAKCPALEEMCLRVWKANDRGVEEDRARLGRRFWARWSMGVDGCWRYEWGFYLAK